MRGSDRLNENKRAEQRSRKRRKRAENHGGGAEHKTVVCPGCEGNIPFLEGRQDPPIECGGCGTRLRCEACGSDIRNVDRSGVPDGICPRCEEPVDGSDEGPGDEDFTW